MKDMFLTDRKLDRRITEVKKYRYRNIRNLEAFAVQEDLQGVVNPQVPAEFDNWDTIHTGDCWSGRDRYLWMHKDIEIPAQWKGQRVVGIFDFGNTGAGNNSGFEAMCYIDGKPYQGVDVNHKEVFFPEEFCGKTVNLTFRLWSGLEGGGVPAVQEHKIRQADLACLDEQADDFYYMGTLILDTIANLEDGNPASTIELEDEDQEGYMKEYNLLTYKPVIYAANVAEDDLADDAQSNTHVQKVREYAKETGSEVFALCAEIEQEISELEDDEKKEFLEDLGIKQSGLEKLIVASYRLLGLLSFLTAGEDETRAWTIKVGTKAPQAAGKIHSDFERGFIKAEVVNYRDLLESGSYAGAREKGLVRMEGKDYVVQDGDVILFRFNV